MATHAGNLIYAAYHDRGSTMVIVKATEFNAAGERMVCAICARRMPPPER